MENDGSKNWKTIERKELLNASPWIRHWVERVALPNGSVVDDYHQIDLVDYSGVVARTMDGRFIFERMYKHGVKCVSLALPGGGINKNEVPLAAAQRELLEETGYAAQNWQSLGSFVCDGNYGCGRAHLFFASEATQIAAPQSGDIEEMEIVLLTPDEVRQCLRKGGFAILGTAAGVAMAFNAGFIK
jgi:ADP-ribose pyrophosphatase